MMVEGGYCQGVIALAKMSFNITQGLSTKNILFPLFRAEGLFKREHHGLATIDRGAETQVAIIIRLSGNQGQLELVIGIFLYSKIVGYRAVLG